MNLLKCLVSLFFITTYSTSLFAGQVLFERGDKGIAITESEKQAATDELIALLKDTRFFDFVDSRIHGSPESRGDGSFWWANMWQGVSATKLNGLVTYTHWPNGSDNIGIATAPFLESACYAYLLTGDPKYAHLARRMIRGFSSWILSSARSDGETPAILSRSFYPASVHSLDGNRNIFLNYDVNRPGINNEVTSYVHIPHNPYFGDIWVKNNRSVDDIGHMLRAIAQVQSCRDVFDEEARADLDQMNALYTKWASDVDANHFNIPTHNLNAERVLIKRGLGDYNTYKVPGFDPTCIEKMAVRLLHSGEAKDLKCGKGISFLEKLGAKFLKNDAIQILRSHHVAAVALAQLKSQTELAKTLMEGLHERMNRDLKVARNIKLSPKFNIQDIASLLINSNEVGVPLTSDEIRFLYERLHIAHKEMRTEAHYNTFHLFDESVPDGDYSYQPPQDGLFYYDLGAMIGTCTSPLRSKERPLLDCERLKEALKLL